MTSNIGDSKSLIKTWEPRINSLFLTGDTQCTKCKNRIISGNSHLYFAHLDTKGELFHKTCLAANQAAAEIRFNAGSGIITKPSLVKAYKLPEGYSEPTSDEHSGFSSVTKVVTYVAGFFGIVAAGAFAYLQNNNFVDISAFIANATGDA